MGRLNPLAGVAADQLRLGDLQPLGWQAAHKGLQIIDDYLADLPQPLPDRAGPVGREHRAERLANG